MIDIAIKIRIPVENLCKYIIKAVEPDNMTAPQNIRIAMECDNLGILQIEIVGNNVHVLTFRNTVDDLLEHISLAIRTLKNIQR